MFPVPRALQTNDLAERGELGIIVGNTPGKHGVCQVYILTRKSICHRTKFQVLRLDASVTHLISKDQNRDPQFLNVEPIPQDINILNETNTLPALPITSTSSSNTTIASIPQLNDSSLIRSDDNNINVEPTTSIMHTVIQRLEPDGSIPIAAEQSMVKELQNILQYQVWTPLSKETPIDDAIRSLMIVVEKYTAAGIFDKWKGRLAAMGNMLKKTPNVDDSSPTMDIASLFILINLANHYGCSMESFDVP